MTTLGQYQFEPEDEIGRGGYATVYRARHVQLQTEVALKVIHPGRARDSQARQRFIREAQAAAALDHPHIVRIYDLGEDQERVFMAMDYLAGGNLQQWREAQPAATWTEWLPLLAQVAEALDYAHDKGVLHRDVKPNNILLDGKGRAYLGDFGLAQVAEASRLTQVGSIVGTPTYLSPEQVEDKTLDGRADQYALAVVAYELLVGRPPFSGHSPTAVSLMHVTEAPPPPSQNSGQAPAEADDVLLRALAKDPAQRYPTCLEFIRTLEAALAASEQRRFREHLRQARQLFEQRQYGAMAAQLEAAARLAARHPDRKEAVAELERERTRAEKYQQGVRAWRNAQQQAQNVLELLPDFPDSEGVFVALGLRRPSPRRRSAAEWGRQLLLGLALGLAGVALWLYLAFRWITR